MKIPITKRTYNAGELVKTETVDAVVMTQPVPEGACDECGRKHEPEAPHDAMSLRYQYRFYSAHHRWPTWADAMAHCPPFIRAQWTKLLTERGVVVDGGADDRAN